jgi:hypothetical protein
VRVARDAIGRAHTNQAGCELIHIGLAHIDRAGSDGIGDNRARLLGDIGELRAGRGCLLARDVDAILDREYEAIER